MLRYVPRPRGSAPAANSGPCPAARCGAGCLGGAAPRAGLASHRPCPRATSPGAFAVGHVSGGPAPWRRCSPASSGHRGRRIRPGLRPPVGAGTVKESTEARRQSSRAASERRTSRTWCRGCQTPARGHSRSLRPQVAPDPQPLSAGSQDQGSPVRRTKMMPRSTSRSATRGRPPQGCTGGRGSRGATTAQRASLTIGWAIMGDATKNQPQLPRF